MKNQKRMFSSLHAIITCAVLLIGITWAWFSETIAVSGTITTATYSAEVSVSGGDEGFVPVAVTYSAERGTTFTVENGKVYDVRIKATGTAPEGYSVISAGDVIWHTVPMGPESEMTITAQFPGTGTREVSIVPSWGSYRDSLNAGIAVSNGDVVISAGDAAAEVSDLGTASEGGDPAQEQVSGNN